MASRIPVFFICLFLVVLQGCGGSSGGDSAPTYPVGGTVSGLSGTGLVLQNNGSNDLAIGANGPFEFTTRLPANTPYGVTVSHQPSDPKLNCVVMNSGRSGMTPSAAVTGVAIRCGKVAGLAYVGYADAVTNTPTSVAVSIDPSTGALAVLPASRSATDITPPFSFAPGGTFGYVPGAAGIDSYSIDNVTGVLSNLAGSPFGVGAVPPGCVADQYTTCIPPTPTVKYVAVQPDGRRLYAYYWQMGGICCPIIPDVYTIVAFDVDPWHPTRKVAPTPLGSQSSPRGDSCTSRITGTYIF